MAWCNHCKREVGRGGRHGATCPRYLASSGPSGPSKPFAERPVEARGNRPVRLPEPLATEAQAARDEGWPDEAAKVLRAERRRRNVVHGKGKDPKP